MIEAFIFDMDGTLFDNMHYHDLAWQATLREYGLDLDMDHVRAKAFGIGVEALERFFGERPTPQFYNEFVDKKESLYRELYRNHIQPIAGLINFLEIATHKNIPMAIATGSDWTNLNFAIDATKIRHYFKTIVTMEQIKYGKPHPESFLEAAQRLNVNPKKCLVFEDVPNGAKAASNADMPCVFLTTTYPAFIGGAISSVVQCVKNYSQLSIDALLTSNY